MNSNHHQPSDEELRAARLTAYALGQLDEPERAALEAELAASDEAREGVRITRLLAGHVYEAALRDPSPTSSAGLREAVDGRLRQLEEAATKEDLPAITAARSPAAGNRRSRWRLGALVALAACLLVAAIGLYRYADNLKLTGRSSELAMKSPLTAAEPGDERDEQRMPGEQSRAMAGPLPADRQAPASVASGLRAPDAGPARDKYDGTRSGWAANQPGKPVASSGGPVPGTAPWGEPGQAGQMPTGMGYGSYPASSPGGGPYGPGGSPSTGLGGTGMGMDAGMGGMPGAGGRASYGPVSGAVGSGGVLHDALQTGAPAGTGMAPGTALAVQNPQADGRPGGYPSSGAGVTPGYAGGRRAAVPPATGTAGRQRAAEPGLVPADRTSGPFGPGEDVYSLEESELPGTVPPGNEQYERIVENPFLSSLQHPLSTFSIDVDTASYANVRRFLRQGSLPPADAVRIEELVNYFRYHYPPPQGQDPFSVSLEVAQCPWNNAHRLVRIGLKGREIERKQRGPGNLVFLLDVSGSMGEPDKLSLVKEAMKMLVEELTEDDRVAIVTYASTTGVALESTNASKKQRILDVIESLTAGGSTNGGAGIQLAYEQAARHFIAKGTNRVILASDGDLNVGITDDDELVRLIREKAKTGVFLTVLGVGTGNLKDSKLEKLADKGNGVYAYLDSVREARRVLVEQIAGSLITIAKDVKIQVEFNPAEVESYRLVGYENRRMAARDFHNDKKDAGEIGAGHTVTVLYELVPGPARGEAAVEGQSLRYQRPAKGEPSEAAGSGEVLTLRLRWKQPGQDQSTLAEKVLKDSGHRFGQASADFQFATAAASFGMLLRGSQHRGNMTFKAVEEIAASALGDDPGGYRAELVDLIRRAQQVSGRR
jgi:Ca-activated chloride channel family protein